jgi:hypothetical protein
VSGVRCGRRRGCRVYTPLAAHNPFPPSWCHQPKSGASPKQDSPAENCSDMSISMAGWQPNCLSVQNRQLHQKQAYYLGFGARPFVCTSSTKGLQICWCDLPVGDRRTPRFAARDENPRGLCTPALGSVAEESHVGGNSALAARFLKSIPHLYAPPQECRDHPPVVDRSRAAILALWDRGYAGSWIWTSETPAHA